MKCPKCAYDCPAEFAFCPKCGTELQLSCSECGFLAPVDFTFCPKCGSELGAPEAIAEDAAPDAVAERLQRLVPKEFAERLLATRGQVEAERRMVTILFSDVKGSTAIAENLDPEDVLDIMNGAFDVLIEPIYRYEGTLARLMGDAILAFFGAPIAHEDDPERACRAALEIIEGARRYSAKLEEERGITGFDVRVGINTGLVVVGEVGSDLRVEYTAVGDGINLASRMEQNAPPGGILITHDTYRHVRGVFDVQRQEPQTVKGRAEPVQTYIVQRGKPRPFRLGMRGVEGIETRMIGREAELKRLQETLHAAMEDGDRQVVTITGEAGVGKSRLLYEFENWIELLPQTVRYFKGRARQEMRNLPYALIRDLFAFRFKIQDSDRATVVRDKMEQGIGEALQAAAKRPEQRDGPGKLQAHFIGQLLGYDFGDSPHLQGVLDDAKQFHDHALTHLTEFFNATTALAPTVIFLEDIQWADDASLDVINRLALAMPEQRLLIVSLARPMLFERRPLWGEGQPFHSRLELQPLSKWDGRRLVDEILQKVDDVPDTLRDLVVAGAEGNPFFVEELIKMLVEDGVIVKGGDQWRVEPSLLLQVRVPPTLTGVLQARLDRLPVEERTILQQASVVGRLFWDRAVVRIGESASEAVEEAEVAKRLSALRGKELVFQRETSAFADSREYIFKHAVLREVTYESLLKRLRRVYHGLVADWLIEQSGERAAEHTGLIADHLELAGRSREATKYLLESGDRARTLYAHQEAIGAYERALALMKDQGDHEQAARTLMKLGLTYHTAFDFKQARKSYEQAFSLRQQTLLSEPAVRLPPAPHAFRRASAYVPTTLDSALANHVVDVVAVRALFSGLVRWTPELNVTPDVATRWEVSADGRSLLFHLRHDVSWSDGAPVTAHDFEYAWKRLLDPATGSDTAGLLFDVKGARAFNQRQLSSSDEVGVRALDDFRLQVELEKPTAHFLRLLEWFAHPVPRHVVKPCGDAWTNTKTIVTNGPFRLESWKPGEALVLARNREYHGRFKGNVEKVEWACVKDWSAKLELYETDKLDILSLDPTHVSSDELDHARQKHADEYVYEAVASANYIAFNPSRAPFDDRRVRRAFAIATDRETLADVMMRGYRFPATGGFIPPTLPGHSPGIALPYNPERARHLLAEAGFPGGRGFPVVEAITRFRGPWIEFLIEQWRQNLGVDISCERMDIPAYNARIASEPPHLCFLEWVSDYPDPNCFLNVDLRWNPFRWRNEAYEELIEQARRVAGQTERMSLFRQADHLLVKEAPVVPVTYGCDHWLVKPWVRSLPGPWGDVIIEPH